MDNLNKFGVLCVVGALFVAGCGKKKSTPTNVPQDSNKMVAVNESGIPLLKDEVDDLLEDSDISDFAFIDDEEEKFEDVTINEVALVADAQNDDFADGLKIDDLLENEETDIASPFTFKTVQFDLNKNSIREDQKTCIEEDIQVAQEALGQGKQVVIEGHCCQTGSASYNLALSQRRAEAVKAEMVKHGLDANNVKTVGYGYERPVVWSDAQDRGQLVKELAPNRRAEVLVN